MRKIVILVVLGVIIISAFFLAFWPKEQPVTTKIFVTDRGITDKNFNKFLQESPKMRAVFFFCAADDDNCEYVNNTVLKNLAESLQVTELDNIYYVDLSATSSTAAAKFDRQWGFSQYPAFVIIDSTVEPYAVVSSLGFHHDTPFNSDDVKKWLITHNIWQTWQKVTE